VPNGDPTFDVAAEEAWFAPMAESLHSFAKRHNLLIERYYHDGRCWTFRFNHPRGGQASIDAYHYRGDAAGVGSSWHLDDYDRFTRYIYWRKPRDLSKAEPDLSRELDAELAAILAVPFGSWNQVADGYGPIWGQYSKEQFLKMTPVYPDPIP
jgi:hypothetical protein